MESNTVRVGYHFGGEGRLSLDLTQVADCVILSSCRPSQKLHDRLRNRPTISDLLRGQCVILTPS